MRIVIIANDSNGLYLFRRQLIRALIEKGNEVIALTPFDTDIDNLQALGVSLVETPIDRRGTNPIRDYSLMRFYRKVLRRIQPNLVVTYTIKPNVYGGIVCRQLKIPYAANITGLGTAFEGHRTLKKVAIILNKYALKEAKVVFFENSENRDFFVGENIVRKEKTYVLHGAGVDLSHFSYQPYPNNEVVKFLFIGRVMKEKGIDELFEAMKRLVAEGEKCFLDVVGPFEDDYTDQIAQNENSGWMKYHGVQSDVRPYIFACDCFVLPSYHEGMANTNLECASCGRPVITSNIHGCLEAVEDGVSGFLCMKKNSDDLYRVMKKFIELSFEQRKTMGVVGRKRMEKIFDKKKVVDETIGQLFG